MSESEAQGRREHEETIAQSTTLFAKNNPALNLLTVTGRLAPFPVVHGIQELLMSSFVEVKEMKQNDDGEK